MVHFTGSLWLHIVFCFGFQTEKKQAHKTFQAQDVRSDLISVWYNNESCLFIL
jgi:hypothetical protein